MIIRSDQGKSTKNLSVLRGFAVQKTKTKRAISTLLGFLATNNPMDEIFCCFSGNKFV